jgi:hypothetical protein
MAWWDDIGNAVQGAAQGAADSFGQFLQEQYGQSPEWIQNMMGQIAPPAPPPEPVEPVEPPYGPGNYEWDEAYGTPWWFSSGDAGVGVSNYEREEKYQKMAEEYNRDNSILEGMGYRDLPATSFRDGALERGPYTKSQKEYLSDVPIDYEDVDMSFAGAYFPGEGNVKLSRLLQREPTAQATETAQHELDHALYYNMLSPKERMQWTDAYNLAVMEGRMKPVRERDYFVKWPEHRAIEMYPERPQDLPYEMYRFYDPPTIPLSGWPEPVWRRQRRPFDPARAR